LIDDLPLWSLINLGFTSLAIAAINKNPTSIWDKGFDDSNSPLHYAVKKEDSEGGLEIAQLLFDNGVAVDSLNDYDRTPLHTATEAASNSMATFLIRAGATVDYTDRWGFTPLYYAQDKACRYPVAFTLIENGADINKTPPASIQALIFAAVEQGRKDATH